MMKEYVVQCYSIYDSVNGTYGPIEMYNNNEVAIRSCRIKVGQSKDLIAMASDLSLYNIGSFDACTGILKPADKVLVIRFSDLVPKEK